MRHCRAGARRKPPSRLVASTVRVADCGLSAHAGSAGGHGHRARRGAAARLPGGVAQGSRQGPPDARIGHGQALCDRSRPTHRRSRRADPRRFGRRARKRRGAPLPRSACAEDLRGHVRDSTARHCPDDNRGNTRLVARQHVARGKPHVARGHVARSTWNAMQTPPERIRHTHPPVRWPDREEAARSRLFSPLEVGRLNLLERTWVPAMVPWRATDEGFVTDDVLAWYERFAEGEPGAIVVEATGVRDIPSGPLLRIGDDRFIPGLTELVKTVRTASRDRTKLFIQIIDFLTIRRRPERDVFFRRYLAITDAHRAATGHHRDE